MAVKAGQTVFNPLTCLQPDYNSSIAVLKLNTPFHSSDDIRLFAQLWKHAVLRACTDGASNVLHDCVELSRSSYLPHFISGDFDSVRPEVLDFYRSQGCEIIATPDQNETDFSKCLRIVANKITSNNLQVDRIVAHVNTEGRLDHILANINTLYLAQDLTSVPVYLLTGASLSCLLPPGFSVINVDRALCGHWCSLVPIGMPCQHVTTTGLQYNLSDGAMMFGGLISTSNSLGTATDTVTVDTDQALLWSMAIHYH